MTNTLTATDARLATVFAALGNVHRLAIVRQLRLSPELNCTELQTLLVIDQSLLSFHLKKLVDAEVINYRPQGRWVYYSLRSEGLGDVKKFLEGVR